MKNEKLFWKQIFEKTFFGFGREKTALARKITRFWCQKKPGYKTTALKEECLYLLNKKN